MRKRLWMRWGCRVVCVVLCCVVLCCVVLQVVGKWQFAPTRRCPVKVSWGGKEWDETGQLIKDEVYIEGYEKDYYDPDAARKDQTMDWD